MSLKVSLSKLQNCPVVKSHNLKDCDANSSIYTRMVYGKNVALKHSRYEPGYHSRPHVHNAEQLKYVLSGEFSIFMFGKLYHLQTGDFLHIPKMEVYWEWNQSDGPCELIETDCPPNVGASELRQASIELLDDSEKASLSDSSETIWLSDQYARDETRLEMASFDDSYWVSHKDIQPSEHLQMKRAGKLSSLFVHGLQSNLMVATRGVGYHSKPHVHQCEQLNLLLSGQLWIFVSGKAFLLEPGDLLRVPEGVPHWAWNDGQKECLLIEVHSPVLDPASKANSVALIPDNQRQLVDKVRNYFVQEDIAVKESEWMKHFLQGRKSK